MLFYEVRSDGPNRRQEGMHKVDLYARVRHAYSVERKSIREAARVFGFHRSTVRKMLRYSDPPGYQRSRPRFRPKLDPFASIIDKILEADCSGPEKQRHTARRIFILREAIKDHVPKITKTMTNSAIKEDSQAARLQLR